MIVTVEESVELVLPAGWRELPPARVMQTDDWMWEWVECTEVACDRRETFTRSLAALSRFARDAADDGRTWIVLSGAAVGTAAVGVAAIRLIDPAHAEVEREFLIPDVHSWSRTRSRGRVPFGEVYSMQDIIVAPVPGTEGESVLTERYIGSVTSDHAALCVQLEIFAPSVDAFGDIIAVGEAALAGLRFA